MERPNILLLFSDEHSFRCMGHVSEDEGGEPVDTPTFDQLAQQGTVFTDAYCQMPLCTPSRICLLTGKEVANSGAWSNCSVLRPELATIPQTLADGGYETCLVGKMHLGGNRQFIGFQHRPYGDLTGKTGHQWEPIDDSGIAKGMRGRTQGAGLTGIPESLIQDEVVCHETVAFIREHNHKKPDKPWFVTASFSRPHFPLTAPSRFFDRYFPDHVTEPKVPAAGDAYDHPMSVGMRKGFMADAIDHDEMMKARAAYWACVSYLDEAIGDMFARLEKDGLLDNTIIIYTTDHGEMAGEHGVWYKNGWYEACTRVPLIVSTPEQRKGDQAAGKVRTPVALVDMFPTICSFAGVNAPSDLDGRDLTAAVTDAAALEDRPVFSDALTPRWGEGTEFRSIRYKQYKYVTFKNAEPLFFDLAADPGEQRNLLKHDRSADQDEALAYLEGVAAESLDFAEAETARKVRDGGLREEFKQEVPPSTGNLYLLPDGRLVNADDPLYNPTVIAETPGDAFSDV